MIHWLIPTPRPTLLVLTQFGVVRLPERLRAEAQRLGRADLQLQELVRDERAVALGHAHDARVEALDSIEVRAATDVQRDVRHVQRRRGRAVLDAPRVRGPVVNFDGHGRAPGATHVEPVRARAHLELRAFQGLVRGAQPSVIKAV